MQVWFKDRLVGHLNRFFADFEYQGACHTYRIEVVSSPDFSTYDRFEDTDVMNKHEEIVLTFKKRSARVSELVLEDAMGKNNIEVMRAHDIPLDQPAISVYVEAHSMTRVFTWMTLNIASLKDYETIFDMNDFVPA